MKPSWRMSRQFPSLTWKMPNSAATTQTILREFQIRRTSQERWCTAVLIPKLIFRKPSTSQTKQFLLVKRSFHPCTGKRWNEQHWEVIFSKFQVLVFIVYHDISGKVYLSPATHVHVPCCIKTIFYSTLYLDWPLPQQTAKYTSKKNVHSDKRKYFNETSSKDLNCVTVQLQQY